MATLFTPLRGERLFDASTGNTTIRFAQYLEDLQDNVNEAVINVEAAEGVFSEIAASISSASHERDKRIDNIDELLMEFGKANARIAELEKTVNNLSQLVE